jgi:hypothetical protein
VRERERREEVLVSARLVGVDEHEVERLRTLFSDPTICDLLRRQPTIRLQVKDDEGWFRPKFPRGVDELHFQVCGVIKEVERLKSLFELFACVLDRLCQMGSAYERDPQIEL